jgi:hypothetical protein
MSIQINILDKVEYYPVWVNNTFEARVNPEGTKVSWDSGLFTDIQGNFTESEVKNIEELILNQFKLIKENESKS